MKQDLRFFFLLVTAAATLFVVGCGGGGSLLESSVDYGAAKTRAPLDVPPDLARPKPNDRYAIPDAGGQVASSATNARGQSVTGDPARSSPAVVVPPLTGVTLQRDGAQRWLHIDQPPEKVWQTLREFWQEAGFVIARESPELGILDTDWAENRAKLSDGTIRNVFGRAFGTLYSTGERDRYRSRIERHDNGTDVFVTHRGMVEVYADRQNENTRWQPRPSDPSLEAEFLRLLMQRFGGDAPPALQAEAAQAGKGGGSGASAAEAAAQANARVTLSSESGDRKLILAEGFDRGWRSVGLALDRTGFTVEDRDRSIGTYFVRYIDSDNPQQQEPGAIARFFGAERPEPALQAYRIVVKEQTTPGRSEVRVLPRDEAKPFNTESQASAERMLGILATQLAQ